MCVFVFVCARNPFFYGNNSSIYNAMHVCMVFVCVCVYTCVYVYVCVYVCTRNNFC